MKSLPLLQLDLYSRKYTHTIKMLLPNLDDDSAEHSSILDYQIYYCKKRYKLLKGYAKYGKEAK